MSEEEIATNVIDEMAHQYYQNFLAMPKTIRNKTSCEILHNIFKHMVVPAIVEVKKLDRTETNEDAKCFELIQLHEVKSSEGGYAEVVIRDKNGKTAYVGNINKQKNPDAYYSA